MSIQQIPDDSRFYYPSENAAQEAVWLAWPHGYTYGKKYRDEIESVWIETTSILSKDQNVRIVAYDARETERIRKLIPDTRNILFFTAKTDDVWIRDSGPIFVFDQNKRLTMLDFAFDGWGKKAPYRRDRELVKRLAEQLQIPRVEIPDFVLEGGAVETDGEGTLMACASSVVSVARNQKQSIAHAEEYFKQYLGVVNFIWLDGVTGEDITDAHIDGAARFRDGRTIVTVSEFDFMNLYKNVNPKDYETLKNAENARHEKYKIFELPMTSKNARGLPYKGCYLNYYVGKRAVVVPTYGDSNDGDALRRIGDLYPDKKVAGVDVSNLYKHGGMIHCITQQQPAEPFDIAKNPFLQL